MVRQLLLLCTAFVTVALDLALSLVPGPVFDLCQTKTLRLSAVGDTGYIEFNNQSLSGDGTNGLGCVLKIESCSSCQIKLEPDSDESLQFFCKTGIIHSKYCSLGCDYLNIFDMYYMNDTNRYYSGLGHKQDTFHSESSNVFIMLCHGGIANNYNFRIRFDTEKKMKKIVGSSDTSSATGLISSPHFPMGYAQNHEVYEYVLTSTADADYIRLTFDDWHLSETSSLYFIGSNRHEQFNGESSRPVIFSANSVMKFTFNTGVSLTAGENRDYIGFRAAYKFYRKDSRVTKPNTNCKGPSYFMDSKGGRINFSPSSVTRELYDCLWVVKTQDGFDGTFLKIIKLKSNGYLFRGNNQLTIRAGTSSTASVNSVFDMLDNIDNGIPHFSKTGFYIRLNASLSSSDSVMLTYASYLSGPGCSSDLFECDNDHCIDKGLMCDGYDHCGDNSDEVSGCAGNTNQWDKSYQYTITIGVIVPMVISVFLIMVICLLFVMIRRCRRARLREVRESSERLPTVSEDVTGRRRRRRHRRRLGLFGNADRDLPPTYDEAIQNPPGWYLNVAFGNPVDPSLPQPPSYHEATGMDPSGTNTNQRQTPGSPVSTDSSQSEVTVCSGNLSDSSSSSDDESTWGVYNGDGDGRRGRLGRHVSSSDSEAGTSERQGRSTVTSPEQNDSLSASVATSTETPQHRDVNDESQNVDSVPKVNKDNDNVANKDIEKKLNDDSDNIVVPAGPKPGGSDPQINVCRPKVYTPVIGHNVEAQSQLKSMSGRVPVASPVHHRNVSSGSETTTENVRKPKKKPRKSKSKKTNNQKLSCHGSEGYFTEHFPNEDASNIPDIVSSVLEKPVDIPDSSRQNDRNCDIPCPEETVIESRQEVCPTQQASDDPDKDLGYQVVVNVDNDNVIVVYDTADRNNEGISQPHAESAPMIDIPGATGSSYNVGDQFYKREPVTEDFQHLDPVRMEHRDPGHLALNHMNIDHSVKSVGNENQRPVSSSKFSAISGTSSSEQFNHRNVQNRNGASESSDLNDQSYISLRSDLNDIEDIYV